MDSPRGGSKQSVHVFCDPQRALLVAKGGSARGQARRSARLQIDVRRGRLRSEPEFPATRGLRRSSSARCAPGDADAGFGGMWSAEKREAQPKNARSFPSPRGPRQAPGHDAQKNSSDRWGRPLIRKKKNESSSYLIDQRVATRLWLFASVNWAGCDSRRG